MRTTKFFLPTLKEIPTDAELISHKLMLRSGMIRKTATGIYTWLPLGFKVLHKVIDIIRQEMNNSGALELFMPAVQPADLWRETGRWDEYGDNMLKIFDRHKHEFCFGPTHEEVITDLMRKELRSYKQLPIILYQIQTKFRDEVRPRFGVMRSREFLMKDAYSFHIDETSLQTTYELMRATYQKIFTRLGLNFRAVLADSGSIGGKISQEFHVLAQSGEDVIAFSDEGDYAANLETATAFNPLPASAPNAIPNKHDEVLAELETVATPEQKTITQICDFLKVSAAQTIKTLLVKGSKSPIVALMVRGDHDLHEIKLSKIDAIAKPLQFSSNEDIERILKCPVGFIGPIGLPESIPIIIDRDAAVLSNFVCGANQLDKHYRNANWQRDVNLVNATISDIRQVVEGDISPDGKGKLRFMRGIEVGHIFLLGTKYSSAMNATVLNAEGKSVPLHMGCYGIGVSRIVAAAIEQNHDDRGIIWPEPIAPFKVVLIPISMHQSSRVREAAEKLYQQLLERNIEVLFDDRKERAGVIFADMELIGIPHRLVISEGNLDKGVVEYKNRSAEKAEYVNLENIEEFISKVLA